jgi:hypothetical protein
MYCSLPSYFSSRLARSGICSCTDLRTETRFGDVLIHVVYCRYCAVWQRTCDKRRSLTLATDRYCTGHWTPTGEYGRSLLTLDTDRYGRSFLDWTPIRHGLSPIGYWPPTHHCPTRHRRRHNHHHHNHLPDLPLQGGVPQIGDDLGRLKTLSSAKHRQSVLIWQHRHNEAGELRACWIQRRRLVT